MHRRQFLTGSLWATIAATGLCRLQVARAAAEPGSPAAAPLVLVVLRGGWDGLSVLVPTHDPHYREQRGSLALTKADGLRPLTDDFALHPALPTLADWYRAGQLQAWHAVATPYRERSHFDAQDLLETGANQIGDRRDGWLNRALVERGLGRALAIDTQMPLVLQGRYPADSWSPDPLPDLDAVLLEKLDGLYRHDEWFRDVLAQAAATEAMVADPRMADVAGKAKPGKTGGGRQSFAALAAAAGRMLASATGPDVVVLELGGWDTHANQGGTDGALANRLAQLDSGLAQLRQALAARWSATRVVIISEFGRTVRPNGTRGTDHGTATCAFVAGGALTRAGVNTDWPGLAASALYQGRDLQPTTDLRSMLLATLADHWRLESDRLRPTVFPGLAPG